jgi:hypothetical protein
MLYVEQKVAKLVHIRWVRNVLDLTEEQKLCVTQMRETFPCGNHKGRTRNGTALI